MSRTSTQRLIWDLGVWYQVCTLVACNLCRFYISCRVREFCHVENYGMQNGKAHSQKSHESNDLVWQQLCFSTRKTLLFLNTSDILHGIYFSAKLIMQLPFSPCHQWHDVIQGWASSWTSRAGWAQWAMPGVSLRLLPQAQRFLLHTASVFWGVFSGVCDMLNNLHGRSAYVEVAEQSSLWLGKRTFHLTSVPPKPQWCFIWRPVRALEKFLGSLPKPRKQCCTLMTYIFFKLLVIMFSLDPEVGCR